MSLVGSDYFVHVCTCVDVLDLQPLHGYDHDASISPTSATTTGLSSLEKLVGFRSILSIHVAYATTVGEGKGVRDPIQSCCYGRLDLVSTFIPRII
jgi:hypothetical protein